jgi:hypothetical protein
LRDRDAVEARRERQRGDAVELEHGAERARRDLCARRPLGNPFTNEGTIVHSVLRIGTNEPDQRLRGKEVATAILTYAREDHGCHCVTVERRELRQEFGLEQLACERLEHQVDRYRDFGPIRERVDSFDGFPQRDERGIRHPRRARSVVREGRIRLPESSPSTERPFGRQSIARAARRCSARPGAAC